MAYIKKVLRVALVARRKEIFTPLHNVFCPGDTVPRLLLILAKASNYEKKFEKIEAGGDSLSNEQLAALQKAFEERLNAMENETLANDLRKSCNLEVFLDLTDAEKAGLLAGKPEKEKEELPPEAPPILSQLPIPHVPHVIVPYSKRDAQALPVPPGFGVEVKIGKTVKIELATSSE